MSNGWHQAYTELTDFIAEHSEVEVEASRVHLPDSVRPEFYRLFDAVTTTLVEEKFPDLLSEAQVLGQSYLKVEQEVIELLGLEGVSASPPTHRFLRYPTDGLRRGLFELLFDLLKGKIGIQMFEEKASRDVEASFIKLYLLGYEKWVILCLVKLLEADKLYQVTLTEVTEEQKIVMDATPAELVGEPVSAPAESKRISFDHLLSPTLTTPDFIVHSTKINGYVSIRSEYKLALATALGASKKREWYPLDSAVSLEPGLTLIYIDDKPEEISLVADAKRICRPDLIIECKEREDWFEKEGLNKVKLHHDSLKPTLGTYIVSQGPVPEQAFSRLENNMKILTVGFDASKLAPIIGALTGQNLDDNQ